MLDQHWVSVNIWWGGTLDQAVNNDLHQSLRSNQAVFCILDESLRRVRNPNHGRGLPEHVAVPQLSTSIRYLGRLTSAVLPAMA